MVKINKIKKLSFAEKIFEDQYSLIFTGSVIDDRTDHIEKLIVKNCDNSSVFRVKVDIENYVISFNEKQVRIAEIKDFLKELSLSYDDVNVLIETTSLDFSEILYLIYGLNNLNKRIDVSLCYIEPEDYNNKKTHLKEKEDFLLSDSRQKFIGLPIFSINSQDIDKSHLVALLGFENHRLGQILEEYDGSAFSNLISMIGIPAFKPGWENRSIHRHIEYFENLNTTMHSYPATNPYELNILLENFFNAYKKIVIASMGTKPAAIAAAVFLVNKTPFNSRNQYVGAIYDFPNKTVGRSQGVGEIYKYELTIN
ncbi:hypothetical protein [Shewanella algae]|uniref:hypothetical protein n=1 Tax=Shewanella algae TaxID=38313 RepID=UPI001BEF2015|nr:hypothetical protein [Shewanella algae]BCV34024.1 hypothetical protein TUM4442_35510 [Shewanella algae]